MNARTPVLALAVIATVVAVGGLRAQQPPRFDHLKHAGLFPTCTGCHQGAEDPEQPILPDSAACATCHDGTTRPYVAWRRPAEGRPSNLKFAHELVPLMTRETPQGTQTLSCEDCHIAPGGQRMAVRRATPEGCLACHGPGVTQHLAAPDSLCQTCHLTLVRATTLRPTDIAGFPAPPSHQAPNFVSRAGHGALAKGTTEPVAASCTVCHAREFCVTCHVDAPEQPAIQALGADARSQAIAVRLAAPPSHRESDFLSRHGGMVREDARACATCHTRESCLACHAPSQRVSAALHSGGEGRGEGAYPVRHPPESHRENFVARHPQAAATTPASCAGCHVRTDCLECHRPAAGSRPGYHPAGFLTLHPAAAYARQTSCSDCHNVGSFCATCHATAGLVSSGPLRSGYHDASRFFVAGHGQAARQSLESCTACHVERDCLTCHSATGGRRFNPHGPGFDANRLRRKNPEMCVACHGATIPTR
jgi:doubled CXXCH motif protein